jgi:hypothetical protein
VPETREELLARMADSGLLVVEPEDYELFIDLDTQEQCDRFALMYHKFEGEMLRRGRNCSVNITPSKSGYPWRKHAVVRVDPPGFTAVERIAWQAILGSDPMRELLSMFRLLDGWVKPTVFFEKEKDDE